MTNLAYIGKIVDINSIDGADFIVSATVVCGEGGKWIGSVKKDGFKVGDLAEVYLQDSILPEIERFEFLKNSNFRIRMRKFKGVPSECLIMPVDSDCVSCNVGDNIAEMKNIKKYVKELPANLSGVAIGLFPKVLMPKTDEPNFQTVEHMVESLKGQRYYSTVKADGSSGTIYRDGEHFGCCSRNLELKKNDRTAIWKIAEKYDLENVLPDGFAIQFEICGPGIQKNRLALKEIDGLIFNVWNIKERKYLDAVDAFKFAEMLKMSTVEVEVWDEVFDVTDDSELRKMAEGKYKSSGRTREGLVFRPMKEQFKNRERTRFKVINLMYKD